MRKPLLSARIPPEHLAWLQDQAIVNRRNLGQELSLVIEEARTLREPSWKPEPTPSLRDKQQRTPW